MNSKRQAVLDKLNELGINYELTEHPAAYTVEQMDSLDVDHKDEIPKNLFLRDDKKKRYILLVLKKDKQVNLKELSQKIGSRPLSFASEKALGMYLGLEKGSVTPLGILNDESRRVEVLIDKSIQSYHHIGVHPNENTATIFIALDDLERILSDHGNKFEYIEI